METLRGMIWLMEEIENFCRRKRDRLFRRVVTPLVTLEDYKIYELLRDAPLKKIFLSIAAKSGGLDKAALSPEEAKKFYKTHGAFVRTNEYLTLFLIGTDGEYSVATVDNSVPGNEICLGRYQLDDYLSRKSGYYVITKERIA